jgi:hypothetical protein
MNLQLVVVSRPLEESKVKTPALTTRGRGTHRVRAGPGHLRTLRHRVKKHVRIGGSNHCLRDDRGPVREVAQGFFPHKSL